MRTIAGVFFVLLAITTSARANPSCLAVRNIESFSQSGRNAVQVTTFDNRLYDVKFKTVCAHDLGSYFVYQQWQLGRCLAQNDTLRVNTGGACVVASVHEVPSYLPPGSGRGSPEVF
jgi:hypothetical protein